MARTKLTSGNESAARSAVDGMCEQGALPGAQNRGNDSRALSIGRRIGKARLFARSLFQRDIGQPHDLYQVEFFLMSHLLEAGALTAKQLGELLSVPRSTVSLHVSRLERRGLLSRVANVADSRSPHIRLTAEGLSLNQMLAVVNARAEDELCRNLSSAERSQLAVLLEKLLP